MGGGPPHRADQGEWSRRSVSRRLPPGHAALNPLAEIVAAPDSDAVVAACFAPLAASGAVRGAAEGLGDAPPHARIPSLLARPAGVVPYEELAAWLDNLAGPWGAAAAAEGARARRGERTPGPRPERRHPVLGDRAPIAGLRPDRGRLPGL